MPTLEDVAAAAQRIKGRVHRTPIMTSTSVTKSTHHDVVVFKCENLQRTGSFKIRGATNAIMKQLENQPHTKDFVTHSSGNHGQAIALAAKLSNCNAHIVVPENAPKVKIDGIRGYDGQVVFCRPTLEDRIRTCETVLSAIESSFFIHPFDNDDVIAGQGTVGLELMEQTDNSLDAVVVPVGGGGLASGVAIAVKGMNPRTLVFAAEPEMADDTFRSFQLGKRVATHRPGLPNSIADGLLTLNSDRTFGILRSNLDGVLRVSETEIQKAMHIVLERCKIVIEPSAAVGVAAVLACPEALARCKRVGIILCGGNVDVAKISQLAKL